MPRKDFFDNPQVKENVLWALVERKRGLPVSDETPQIQKALSFIEEKGGPLFMVNHLYSCVTMMFQKFLQVKYYNGYESNIIIKKSPQMALLILMQGRA